MYPYHNKIKQRIKNNELKGYEYIRKYKSISPCLLLHFVTEPKIRPIREHRFKEYEAILNNRAKREVNGLNYLEQTECIPNSRLKN